MTPFRVRMTRWGAAVAVACVVTTGATLTRLTAAEEQGDLHRFTPAQLATLRFMSLESLGAPPDDPSNAYDTSPRAARLGRSIFFDVRFSANGGVACGTCHLPGLDFQDGRPRARGLSEVPRRTMPLAGAAHQTWLFWDGRKDSLWSQALAPLESPIEHGISRSRVAVLVREHYRTEYEAVFGSMPSLPPSLPASARPADDDPSAHAAWEALAPALREDITRVYVNVGKAIAAFVRTIQPGPSRFDRYVEALLQGDTSQAARILHPPEVRGLRLFIGKAKCTNCHSGPLLTNGEFHATFVPRPAGQTPDPGRAEGLPKVLGDEFNCLSRHSDAAPGECTALRFVNRNEDEFARAFKTPTLRNVAARAPYMHAGQLATLKQVLVFYRTISQRVSDVEHSALTDQELADLEAFLQTLTGPVRALEP